MKIRTRLFLVSITFWLFQSFQAKAQVQTDSLLLHDVLFSIEKQFNVQFNYAEETITDIYIEKPNLTLEIEAIIDYLQVETGLIFSKQDDQFILIKSSSKNSICGYIKNINDNTPVPLATI